MIPEPHIGTLLRLHMTLYAHPNITPIMTTDCENSCSKLFKKIWKLSGKPEGNSDFGRDAFFNRNGVTTSSEIRVAALNHILSKNKFLCLSSTITALQEGNLDLARTLLIRLYSISPRTFEQIECLCANSTTSATLEETQAAVEKIFISEHLDGWIIERPDQDREKVKTAILSYLENPEQTKLYLKNYKITDLPPIFSAPIFKKTTILDLSNTGLVEVPATIAHLTNLKELHLSSNKLKTLPRNIEKLTEVKVLFLKENSFEIFPNEITRFSKLEFLDFSNNKILSLPDTIGNLRNLVDLYLDKTKLTTLPHSIHHLTGLKFLSLDDNELTLIPEPIFSLQNLTYLSLSGNNLSTLPDGIRRLTGLTDLLLDRNNFSIFPDIIIHLSQLALLALTENSITAVPSTIENLKKLEILLLSRNRITILPDEICNLPNLSHLLISNNELMAIPNRVGNLENLKKLELYNNKLTSLPPSLISLKNLIYLYLEENPMTTLQKIQKGNWAEWKDFLVKPHILFASIDFYAPLSEVPPFPYLISNPLDVGKITNWLMNIKEYMAPLSADTQTQLIQSVREFLEHAETNPAFRSDFITILDEVGTSCIDGLTLSLSDLRIAKILNTLDFSNIQITFSTCTKVMILSKAKKIAIEKIKTTKEAIDLEIASGRPRTLDEIDHGDHISVQRVEREYLLYYLISLKTEFDLPIDVSESLFSSLTKITEDDIEEAKTQIREILGTPDLLHRELLQFFQWNKALEIHDPRRFRAIPEDEGYMSAKVALSRSLTEAATFSLIPKEYIPLFEAIHNLGARSDTIGSVLSQIEVFQGTEDIITKYNAEKEEATPLLPLSGLVEALPFIDSTLLLAITKEFLLPIADESESISPKKRKT